VQSQKNKCPALVDVHKVNFGFLVQLQQDKNFKKPFLELRTVSAERVSRLLNPKIQSSVLAGVHEHLVFKKSRPN
jgi:hypothetical protein